MKLDKFIKLFDGLDPNTEITLPELRVSGNNTGQASKLDLNLELFRIKDKEYELAKEKIIRENTLMLILIIVLIIICLVQLTMLKFGIC